MGEGTRLLDFPNFAVEAGSIECEYAACSIRRTRADETG